MLHHSPREPNNLGKGAALKMSHKAREIDW
jgi:hypothetical protein